MTPFKPFPQRRSSSCVNVRLMPLAAWLLMSWMSVFSVNVWAAAKEQAQLGRSGAQGHSYRVDVAVVSAKPIEVTRTVERPEKTCELVRQTSYRGSPSNRDSRHRSASDQNAYDYRSRDSSYERRREGRGGVGAQILGGLIGGAIGNQFGGGKGKKALTIAGALIGSSVARGGRHRYDDDYHDDDRYYSERREIQPEYRCRTTTSTREVTQITGYDVTYRYNNTLYKRRMDYDPGDTFELRVRAVPDVASTVADS